MKNPSVTICIFVLLSFVCSCSVWAVCDNNVPTWYLEGTSCEIYPYYYKAEISANNSWFLREGDPQTGASSGSCTEYWNCVNDGDCSQYSCDVESVYSYEDDYNDIYVGLTGFESNCFYSSGLMPGNCDPVMTGSWNSETKVYNGTETWECEYYDENNDLVSSEDFSATITVTAVFDRSAVEPNCVPEPVVRIEKYEETMFVRPKNGNCCEASSGQTIKVKCAGASHIKVSISGFDGELVHKDSSYIKGCTETHAGSGEITIIPNHDKFTLVNNQPKTEKVTYSVAFYDSAGNYINTGMVNVTLTTQCEDEPK